MVRFSESDEQAQGEYVGRAFVVELAGRPTWCRDVLSAQTCDVPTVGGMSHHHPKRHQDGWLAVRARVLLADEQDELEVGTDRPRSTRDTEVLWVNPWKPLAQAA